VRGWRSRPATSCWIWGSGAIGSGS
jgi:hypothetical protein